MFNTLYLVPLLLLSKPQAQTPDLLLKDWQPQSQLVVKETRIEKPKFPVIDFHNHLGRVKDIKKCLEEMDKAGVVKCVSLDGFSEKDLYKQHLRALHAVSKDLFIVFFLPDFSRLDEPDFGNKKAARLEEAVRLGVCGLKIAKSLGLTLKDKSGRIIPEVLEKVYCKNAEKILSQFKGVR
jgi:hypothetical protein